jgi:hypothetical protein
LAKKSSQIAVPLRGFSGTARHVAVIHFHW